MTGGHSERAAEFLKNADAAAGYDRSVWHVRAKRDAQVAHQGAWEQYRSHAAALKSHTLGSLAELLESFERHATANGFRVHWAADGAACNETVYEILSAAGVRELVKSKSMLTEECGLNPFLEQRGVTVTDTDLGERIVQLRGEPPSHIVLPAIHLRKEQVGELFHEKLGIPAGESDPVQLTAYAREHLRERFRSAHASLSGANFLIPDTGGVVICTNEGNFDLALSLSPLHVVCVGIEKLIPRFADLPLFLRLLARSATGQAITAYTTHVSRPLPGQNVHVILVDNGRTAQLAHPSFRRALACIRCGACLNTCPIYRRSGGASYDATIPGPIGSVLSPLRDHRRYASLPFASSLCGSCSAVCPVKIPIHELLLDWRGELVQRGLVPLSKRLGFGAAAFAMRSSRCYQVLQRFTRTMLRVLPRGLLYGRLNVWGRHRELPDMPPESFREWYQRQKR